MLFLILLFLAGFHLLYDGILAPSIRYELRFQLFALRDKIRSLKIKHGKELDDEVYLYLENSINGTIKYLHLINLSVMYEAYRSILRDKGLKEKIERQKSLLRKCSVVEVNDVIDEHSTILQNAVLANVFGWFIYIVPLFALLSLFKQCADLIKTLTFLPEQDIEGFLPPGSLTA